MTVKTTLIAATAASFLALAACGDKGDAASKAAEKAKAAAADTADKAMEGAEKMADKAQDIAPVALGTSAIEAQRWMAANGARPNVITLPSGLQYSINNSGAEDGVSPTAGQNVKVHYEGKLIDGTVFDSSYERGEPNVFPSDRLIAGWVEALGMMKPGDSWTLYIPPELAYGADGRPGIPPNAPLIFRMELLENM